MYCYIYDDFVQERKFERELAAIEARITDLGLQGKIVRLALFRHPNEIIEREVAAGVKTVVVVGNDETVHKVANAIVDHKLVLGIIPLGSPNAMARVFGIPSGVAACDVLTKRRIEKLDAGRVNDHRFFTSISFLSARGVVRYNKQYDVIMERRGDVHVVNMETEPSGAFDAQPTDGSLDVFIMQNVPGRFRKRQVQSHLPLKCAQLLFEDVVKVKANGVEISGNQFKLSSEPGALQVIVGRERSI